MLKNNVGEVVNVRQTSYKKPMGFGKEKSITALGGGSDAFVRKRA